MIWKERYKIRIRVVQMHDFIAIIRVRRTDRKRNERIRKHVGVCTGVDEVRNKSTMKWHSNLKKWCRVFWIELM